MNPLIELIGVTKTFGPNLVLHDVNLTINPGASVAIIGGSGAGKSVLVKCMLGLMAPSSGQVRIGGHDINKSSARVRAKIMRRIGVLFQGSALFDSLTIWENVSFRLLNAEKMARGPARATAIDKLLQVGLSESVANLYPSELSGGMQKRAGLARAICGDPDILFFDEPTTGLDPVVSGQINRLLSRTISETNATAVTITHSMDSVTHLADQVVFLHDRRVIWNGQARHLRSCDNPIVARFVLGQPDPNME